MLVTGRPSAFALRVFSLYNANMSVTLEAIKDKPVALFQMDDTAPFQDYSGYNKVGSVPSGTTSAAISLANGAVRSTVFNRDAVGRFESPVFRQGYEKDAFSLESWVYPIRKTLGHEPQIQLTNSTLNPTFETGVGHWVTPGGTTAQDTTWKIHGTYSMKVTNSGSLAYAYASSTGGVSTRHPVSQGQYVHARVTIKALQACYIRFVVFGYDSVPASTSPIGVSPEVGYQSIAANEIRTFEIINALSDNPDDVGFLPIIYIGSRSDGGLAPAGDVLLVDGMASYVTDEPLSLTSLPFVSGDQPGMEWLGTPHASKSRTRSDVNSVNLLTDPDMKVSGWSGVTYSGGTATVNASTPYTPYVAVPSGTQVTGVVQVFNPTASSITFTTAVNTTGPDTLFASGHSDGAVSTTLAAGASATIRDTNTLYAGETGFRILMSGATGLVIQKAFATYGNYTGSIFSGSDPGSGWIGSANASVSYRYVSDGEQQILGNTGQVDGLTIDGTVVSFTTKYLNSGECRASYDLQIPRRFHAVGVHTSEKNSLYIDGELVAETELTEAQKTDQFVSTDAYLYSGQSSSSMRVAVNSIGIYATALSGEAIARHYATGNSHVPRDSIPSQFGGVRIPLSQSAADVFLSQTWSSDDDWNSGYLVDTTVEDAQLRPRLVSGISVPGIWENVFPLDSAGVTSIYGVNMLWDGEGAIVSASLDGTTWETAERGKNLTLIPAGFDPTDKELYVRVSFVGGIEDDPSFIDNLTITGFKTELVPVADREVNVEGYVQNDYEPVELRDDFGLRLPRGKKLTISNANAFSPQTIEIWAKGSISTNIGSASVYSFGTGATMPQPGEWQNRTYVLAAPTTSDIVITSNDDEVVIGQIVLYPEAKTAAQIKEIYDAYVGVPRFTVNDSSTIGIAESPEATTIYDYDWSISASA